MSNFMAYKAGYDSCSLLNGGIWQPNIADATFFSIYFFCLTQTGTESKICEYEPNARPIENQELYFGNFALGFILVVLAMSFLRLSFNRSGLFGSPQRLLIRVRQVIRSILTWNIRCC